MTIEKIMKKYNYYWCNKLNKSSSIFYWYILLDLRNFLEKIDVNFSL